MTDTPELKEETPKLITREEYIADIKTRWKIFVKETEAFIEDVKKLVSIASFNSSSINEFIDIYSTYELDISLSAKFKRTLGE